MENSVQSRTFASIDWRRLPTPLYAFVLTSQLADKNRHIIQLYQLIQEGKITPGLVRQYLEEANAELREHGQIYYYEVRKRFNQYGDSLDFLFLNRACFNGVMRFNQKGAFNVPFGHKPERFRQAYVTKIVNQVRKFQTIVKRL